MVDSAARSAVLDRYGLRKAGFWHSIAVSRDRAEGSASEDLAESLRQLGGIYTLFGRFLGWRADLLGARYIASLRHLDATIPPPSIAELTRILERELPEQASRLLFELSPENLWSTVSRAAWRTRYRGLDLVLQIARAPISDAEFALFEECVQQIQRADVARVSAPHILREFRQWLRDGESLARERKFLDVLGDHQDETAADYPVPLPDLSTDSVLCWPWVEGEPAARLIAAGSSDTAAQIATAVFEQFYSTGIVDADIDIQSFVVTPDNRLTVRRVSRLVSVPPASVNAGMKYIAAVLAGDSTLTVQTLYPLAAGRSSAEMESKLLNALSAVEPELKVHLRYPRSAAAFESNWRALSRLHPAIPPYLNSLHRNMIAVGYWNADAIVGGAPVSDALEQAQWPALRRVLRTHTRQFQNPDTLDEWTAGAGLLLFGSLREANRLAEEIRDNRLTMGVQTTAQPENRRHANRTVSSRATIAFLLITLLLCLHWGTSTPEPVASLLKVLALVSLGGLFCVVARIR